jgi:hypothetical protein
MRGRRVILRCAVVNVKIQSDIDKLFKNINNVSKKIKSKVIKSSINETVKVVNTATVKTIRGEGYNMPAAEIKKSITKFIASERILSGGLVAKGDNKNLKYFGAKSYGKKAVIKRIGGRIKLVTGGGVTVKVKGTRKIIKHAFINNKGYVMSRVVHRLNKESAFQSKKNITFKRGFTVYGDKIKYLRGPSIPQAFANEIIVKTLQDKVHEHLPKRLEHNLKRLMQE